MRAKLYPVDRSLLNGPLHSSAAALQKHDRRVTEMLDKRQQHRDNESTGDERRLLHTLEMEAPHIVMRELRAKQQEKGQKPAGNIGYRPKAIDMLMRFPPETTDSVVMRDENITALPHHLDSLNHITHLDVSTNYLLELSPAISELRKLEHLDVSANELSALPDTINLSTRLVTLLARNNRIATLPDRWTGLNYLRELDVSFNRCPPRPTRTPRPARQPERRAHAPHPRGESFLLELPAACGLSKRARAARRLDTVPGSISELYSLERLDISHCQLRELPHAICALSRRFQTLRAGFNFIFALPRAIGKLKGLTELSLPRCPPPA